MSEARPASVENRAILRKLLLVALLMFGFGWALIPLYRKICEVTGINLLTNKDPAVEARARNTQVDTSRTIVVEFDANRQGPWRFKPHVNHLTVHPGELVHVDYDLVNLESRAMTGQAYARARSRPAVRSLAASAASDSTAVSVAASCSGCPGGQRRPSRPLRTVSS